MSNGCGCERGLFRWVKPPYAEKFRAACELHDDYYEWGYLSRKKCDEVLFMNMVRKVNETETKTDACMVVCEHCDALLCECEIVRLDVFQKEVIRRWNNSETII